MIQRLIRFVTHDFWMFLARDLWVEDPNKESRLHRVGMRALRISVLVAERVWAGKYALRASALTYSTLLSMVPFLAFAFSVAKGFGIQERLEPFLNTYLAAGQEQIGHTLMEYVNKTDVKALGTVGLIFMLVTVVMVIGSAEDAFNEIWGIARARPWGRKFADYLSVTVVFPILVLAASGLNATLASQTLMIRSIGPLHLEGVVLGLLQLARAAAVWLAFSFLYIFLPNTKVRLGPAMIGGVVAGSVWLLAQWGYIHFQVGVSRYNAIYGTFAALPIFLVWLYVSWVIVLLGAELVYAVHIVHGESRERRSGPLSARDRKRLALRLALMEAARLDAGRTPAGENDLIDHLGGISARQVRSVLDTLDKSKIFQSMELSNGEFAHILRQSPDKVRIAQFLETFDREGQPEHALPESPVDEVLNRFEQQQRDHAMNRTLRELRETIYPSLIVLPDGHELADEPGEAAPADGEAGRDREGPEIRLVPGA